MNSLLCFLFLLPLFLFSVLAGSDRCFFPNGKPAQSAASCWEADGNQTALCCQFGDLCLNNHVCAVKVDTGEFSYYRGSCLDSTWSDPNCPHFCDGSDRDRRFVSLHRCSGDVTATKWFCENEDNIPDDRDCSSVDGDVELPAGLSVYATAGTTLSQISQHSGEHVDTETTSGLTTPSSVPHPAETATVPLPEVANPPAPEHPGSPSSAATGSAAPTPVSSHANNDAEDDKSGSGIPIGVGVTVGACIPIASSVILFFYQRRRRRRAPVRAESPPPFEFSLIGNGQAPGIWMGPSYSAKLPTGEPQAGLAKIYGDSRVTPWAGGAVRYELP
ncbi:hypothetical protein C7999DRAFT_16914 [Corynascus novoguineensis]|uniref:Uncharacterized protein n=1 Tax=Corynascus novoguineensis TaxID=1126955 RepID=A0AAN7HM61_9PEZI|nr:hypothetical protein C7999DRAFT_16914 [Corynascus novoguineensis]